MPAKRNPEPLSLIYDPEDEALIKGSPWSLSNGYPSRRRNGRLEYLHVLIAGAVPGKEVDHENGNKLDVRRSNLRHLTHHANTQNMTRLPRTNRSGFRGVSFKADRGKWRATARLEGRQRHLGYFESAEDAAEAARAFRLTHMEGATA